MVAIFFTILFAVFNALQAQDSTSLDEVKLSVWNGKLSPFAKNILSAKDIAKVYTAQDLPFVLQQLAPSVVAYSDNGLGVGQTGFRVRGTDPSRTLFTVNGMPFNDAESQGVFIGNIPDIASSATDISVQRGVGASSSAGASLGASVQINTLKKADNYNHFALSTQYGSYATMRNTVSWHSAKKRGFSADIRASQIHSDGYVERAKANYYALYTAVNYEWMRRSLHLVYFGGMTRNVQAWNGVSKEDLQKNRRLNTIGVRQNKEPYNAKDHYAQHNWQLIYKDSLSKKINFSNIAFVVYGRGFYDSYKEQKDLRTYLPNSNIIKGDIVNENWLRNVLVGDIAQLQIAINKKHSLQMELGTQFYQGKHLGWVYGGDNTFLERSKYYDFPAYKYNASSQLQWRYAVLPELSLYTDLQMRIAYHKIIGDRENSSAFIQRFFLFANPKIGINYSKNQHNLFLSYAYSGREPTRSELVETLGQTQAEYLQDIEMAYSYALPRFRITHTLYYMFYANQLVLTGAVNDVGAFLRKSIGRSLRTGIEQELYWAIGKNLRLQSNLSLARNLSLKENSLSKAANLPFSPNIIAAASLQYNPWRTLVLNLRTQYVGTQYMDASENIDLQLSAYWLQFLSLSYTHNFKKASSLTARARIDNIFDVEYSPNGYVYENYAYYFPAAGRTYSLQVLLNLSW